MMQKRNLYSFLIAKGESREQLTCQDILSVKVSNQEGEKQYIVVPPRSSRTIYRYIYRNSSKQYSMNLKTCLQLAKALNELSKFDKWNPSTKYMYRRISVLQYYTRTDYQVLFSSPNLWY